MAVKAIPDGYYSLTPYLVIKGAAEAIEFYKKVFGATETVRMPGPGGRIMHAEVKIGNSVLMLVGRKSGARLPVAEDPRRHDLVGHALHRRCGCDVQEGGRGRREGRSAADGHVLGRSHGQHHRSVRPQLGDRDAQGRRLAGGDGKANGSKGLVKVPKVPRLPGSRGRPSPFCTNGAACSPKIGPWPPFGTTHSDAFGIPRNNSTASSTGYSGSRSPCTISVLRGDRRQRRGGEVHVVAIVGELARVAPQRADLIVAEVMAAAHLRPLRLRSPFLRHRPHDRARLIGKARRAADVNHRGDARRLLRGHVQQRVRAGAHADRLDAIDAEVIEQREDVARDIGELEDAARDWSIGHGREDRAR